MISTRVARWGGLLAVALCGSMVFGACSSSKKSDTAATATTTTVEATTSTAAAQTPVNSGATIETSEFLFSPSVITVKAGDTVTWTDAGSSKHTVTPDVPAGLTPAFQSTSIAPGETFVATFLLPGTYQYFCSIHPDRMSGTITVQ